MAFELLPCMRFAVVRSMGVEMKMIGGTTPAGAGKHKHPTDFGLGCAICIVLGELHHAVVGARRAGGAMGAKRCVGPPTISGIPGGPKSGPGDRSRWEGGA